MLALTILVILSIGLGILNYLTIGYLIGEVNELRNKNRQCEDNSVCRNRKKHF